MSPAKATDFPLLLEVFREGLLHGIISKKDVTSWADSIIIAEDEPDYFFIEISLSADKNSLFETLGNHVIISGSVIPSRVILGLVYKKLVEGEISLKQVIAVLNSINNRSGITSYERSNIYSLDDDYYEIIYQKDEKHAIELTKNILEFLICYGEFTLKNYDQWPKINEGVEEFLREEQAKGDIRAAEWSMANAKRARVKKRRLYISIAVLTMLALGIIIFDYNAYISKTLFLKFEGDLYQIGIFYLAIFAPYFMLRMVYVLWKKVKRVA